ncbi:hypothetical protein GCM10009821_24880 [Aeromicrobium halocynthiae]|uniref:Uncharacterized protein n=1 Tax=Aeromicrobium halocynthiae TaxID=560557 RepID=A0ABN2W656_9ACTN
MTAALTVTVHADPGLPTRRARGLRDDLRETLEERCGVPVTVEVTAAALGLTQENVIDLRTVEDAVPEVTDPDDARVVLVLTEIPRHRDGRPLVAELEPDRGIAVVSCPTLGVWRSRRRLLRVLQDCVLRSVPETVAVETGSSEDVADLRHRWTRWCDDEVGPDRVLMASGPVATARMVMGMTAANEPLRTAVHLSTALAAAMAVGAFGIFYSSIWEMAAASSPSRLALVALTAMVSMTAWLLWSNRLWDRARLEPLRRIVALYNLSTILTLALCVVVLYAVLVLVILAAAALVIEPTFMASVLDADPTPREYLEIAVLSASMGVVAGALGSSFDSDVDVRDLTHGQRERQRLAEVGDR